MMSAHDVVAERMVNMRREPLLRCSVRVFPLPKKQLTASGVEILSAAMLSASTMTWHIAPLSQMNERAGMDYQLNDFGQPVGVSLPEWTPRLPPDGRVLQGRYCRLEHLDASRHGEALFQAYGRKEDAGNWTYLSVGPFENRADFDAYMQAAEKSKDPFHYAIIDSSSGNVLGTVALMRIDSGNGVIEVGFVTYSSALKQSRIATEAQFLLMCYALETLGYRRYEWKCDSLNHPSRSAALRLGFRFEGVFRNAVIYKGRSRDTAWFSIIDSEWPYLREAYEKWLAPDNFDEKGLQRLRLSALVSPVAA